MLEGNSQNISEEFSEELEWLDENRPKNRSECKNHNGPCPFFSCQYHLGLFINKRRKLVINFMDLDENRPTCILDIIEYGIHFNEKEVSEITGIDRLQVAQIEKIALRRLKKSSLDEMMSLREYHFE